MAYFGNASRMTGDPGFFDTLKKIGRSAVGAGVGFVTGGAAGAIRGGVSPFIRPATPPRSSFGSRSIPQIAASPGPTVTQFFTPSQQAIGRALVPTMGGGCPSGYHPAKDGSGRCVKNRRMNPYNQKAARRATRRLKSLGTGMKSLKKAVREADRALSK